MTDKGDVTLAKFEEAADEWENVAEITPSFRHDAECGAETRAPIVSPLTRVDEVVNHINTSDMEGALAQVSNTPRTKGGLVKRVLSCFTHKPVLPPHLRHTKRLVQATALVPFDNQEPIHLSILRTLHRQLTGSRVDCPRYGSHWEDIGFQGNDPATDLRGVGLLGLVQALYLVVTPEMVPFARDVYRLSRNESQEFPLLVLSLNITRITLHILRDGLLDRFLVLEDDVWSTTNFLYCALLHHVFIRWRGEHLTITSSGFVLQETETVGRKQVGRVIQRFEKFLQTEYSVADKQAARELVGGGREGKP